MRNTAVLSLILLLAALAPVHGAAPGPATRPPTQAEKDFYASTVLPAMTTVRRAIPREPKGWVVQSETPIASSLPGQVTEDAGRLRFTYEVSYRRINGMADEVKRLNEIYAEANKKHGEAATALSAELAKKQAEVDRALKKAVKNRAKKEEKQLRKELEQITARLQAIPDEREQAILADTDEYLIRDAEFAVRVEVNASSAGLSDARAFSRPKAAYALKKEGGRVGHTGWQPDRLMILYGDWVDAGKKQFRGIADEAPLSPRVRTIALTITGDRDRTEQFLKDTGMKEILGLMK